ncbi:MAG: serine hydrolase, partial [Mucilaginibacter sp.]|nr:serine hydrolase [Mucilaginibacter sp.]
MKAFILIIACTLQLVIAKAQISTFSRYKQLNDTLIALYNRDDFKGIFRLGNDFFISHQSEDDCVNEFSSEKKRTGKIVSSQLIADLGSVKHFAWVGQLKTAKLELRSEDGMIKQYRIGEFIMQPGNAERSVPNDNPLKSHIDSIVHQYALVYMSDPQAVALSIGVYKDGKKYTYNYGEVKKGSGILPTGNTIYQIGSIAKTFIGVLLAKAVVDKKMQLIDDVRKYLPGNFQNLSYKGHPITLTDLANHTGGFRKFNFITYPNDVDHMPWNDFMKYLYAYPRQKVIADLHRLKLDTLPGAERNYSVGGFIILGMALETAYGEPLNKLFNEYYGGTLHMKETKLNSDPSDRIRFATPYDEKGQAVLPMLKSAPGLFTVKSTSNDMLKYVEENIKENDLAILLSHKPTWGDITDFSVGLGWQIADSWEKGLWIYHSGHDAGYNSL